MVLIIQLRKNRYNLHSNNMKNSLIIGIDLSFNSTGISIAEFENTGAKTIEFHRLVFDDNSTIKVFVPKPIYKVNQYTYKLPVNITTKDIIVDTDDYNSLIQADATIKCMICVKRLMDIVVRKINKVNNIDIPLDVYFNIEGFLMPQVQGEQQFKSLSGLIMLQGMLRAEIIRLKLSDKFNIDNLKIFITTPKELKKWFSGNGNADKQVMLDSFYNNWEGRKLLPDVTSVKQINDVIDAFALMMNAYGKIIGVTEIKKKIKKPKVKKFKNSKFKNANILVGSIPQK